ncbi:MAG: hypothetical protein BGO37_12870 [Cellulomonas sp. 73-92]|nr:MAG: hypothetical protein BGO37_12870 [Cellulomonas sp. 73-92]
MTHGPVVRSSVRLSWQLTDRHSQLTWAALGGGLAAVALAFWGLPAIDLHGPLHRLGIMDLLCGGTRAAYLTMTGRWTLAWYYNPLGPLAVVAAAVLMLRAGVGLLTRHWLTLRVRLSRRVRRVAVVALAVVVVVLTARQQLLVDVLR